MTLGSILSALSPYRMNAAPANDDDPSRPTGAELVTEDGRSLPLVGAKLGISAGGGLARAVLEQEFENVSDDVLAVTYKMPLPADGAVSAYAFQIGERTVTGRVDPKATARERFEQALAEGKTAALLEQDKPDIFTQRIANIPPRARVTAKITVDQRLAWLAEGEWELRFPTVIGPRYVGSTETGAQAEAVAIDTAPGPLPARVRLEMRVGDAITPGRRVESPSHALFERPDGAVELREPAGARLDRDLVARWAVAKPSIGVSLEVARPPAGKPNADSAYGLLTIVPPSPDGGTRAGARPGEPSRAQARWPRDLVVLLDTSGSMGEPRSRSRRRS
jgi:Ca-activated chloride channel family protein